MKIFNVVVLKQSEASGVIEAKAFPCADRNVAAKMQKEIIEKELANDEDWISPSEEEMTYDEITLVNDYNSDFYEVKIEEHELILN